MGWDVEIRITAEGREVYQIEAIDYRTQPTTIIISGHVVGRDMLNGVLNLVVSKRILGG